MENIHPNQTTIYDFLPNRNHICEYAIADELEDNYCCNYKCDKCGTVIYESDCKDCIYFK